MLSAPTQACHFISGFTESKCTVTRFGAEEVADRLAAKREELLSAAKSEDTKDRYLMLCGKTVGRQLPAS